jgi:NADH:ubiquinone oxidoreductase subunit 2 (subunit N)
VHRTRAEAHQRLKRPSPVSLNSKYVTPETLRIVGALALAIVAVMLGEVSRLLAVLAAIASLIVFFSLWFPTSGTSSSTRPRWRGRDLD